MNKTWDNKVVLISGGLGDIALATALAFGKEGAKIALADIIDVGEHKKKAEVLNRESIDFIYSQVDISQPSAVAGWVEKVDATWGRMDVAIMNAASLQQNSVERISVDEWQLSMNINLNGAFYMARQAAVYMKSRQLKGNLIFMGSWAAHAVHPAIPAYSVAKAGIRMLCQCMALEFASDGIRVNEIAPGYVNAGLSKEVWKADPALADEARARVPVGLLITPEEVAANIIWICNDNNRNLTGSTLVVDGGLSLLRP